MKKFDINDIKFGLAQKYGLPESEIDESVIGIYVLIDKMGMDMTSIASKEKQELSQSLEEMRSIMRNKYKSVIYDNPKSAFWGNFGSRGITGLAISISIIVVSLVFHTWYNNQELVKNLQNLRQHVKVTPEGYFIPKSSYDTQKDGIIIKQ